MKNSLVLLVTAAGIAACCGPPEVCGETLGTVTIADANHYGYFGFPSTSANNTKETVGPFSGIARTIHVEGTITRVHPDAYARSIRVYPSGAALAGYQPWFQFSRQYDFTGTIPVSATIYARAGLTCRNRFCSRCTRSTRSLSSPVSMLGPR